MDHICDEIQTCISEHNYKQLFAYNDESIQIYFDNICIKSNIEVADLLLKLFPHMGITNALIYAYTNHNKPLFELLCSRITPQMKDESPKFIEHMLLYAYEHHKGDKHKYILRDLLQILLNQGVFKCDDMFTNALSARLYQLARLMIKLVSHETIAKCFESAYREGNAIVAKMTYERICMYRIVINPLGYCPAGSIIKMIRFQEYYKWEELLVKAVEVGNYYVIEALIEKIRTFGNPCSYNLPFNVIEPVIAYCPDSLLFEIMDCFTIIGFTYEHVKLYNRIPLTNYYENKIMKSDWLLVR